MVKMFFKIKFSPVFIEFKVPDTETQGRVHTSAASVAVLPKQRMLISK